MPDNDDKASALIDALAPKIAEAIMPKITESVEAQMKGLKDKNAELLDKLVKDRAQEDAIEKLRADGQALIKSALEDQRRRFDSDGNYRKAGDPVRIKKSDARDVKAYRAAKKLATEQGVALEIVADD